MEGEIESNDVIRQKANQVIHIFENTTAIGIGVILSCVTASTVKTIENKDPGYGDIWFKILQEKLIEAVDMIKHKEKHNAL
jgi:hypothetical protein